MKISYSNCSTLRILKEKKIDKFKLYENDLIDFQEKPRVIMEKVFEHFNFNLPCFSENIFFVSESFYEAFTKSADKLLDLYTDIITNNLSDFSVKGTFILKGKVWMVNLEKKEQEDFMDVSIYIFDKNQTLLKIIISNIKHNFLLKEFSWDTVNKTENELQKLTTVASICILNMFIKYAEIETNILMPKTKSKNINCLYNNQTDFKITQLDCTWFTNIIRSEGFKVRGHFRLQPYSDGSKKIIWINEFQKKGYSIKAKVLRK